MLVKNFTLRPRFQSATFECIHKVLEHSGITQYCGCTYIHEVLQHSGITQYCGCVSKVPSFHASLQNANRILRRVMKHSKSNSITATYVQCCATWQHEKRLTVQTALLQCLDYISFFDPRKRKRNALIFAWNLLKNVEVYDFEISQTESKYVMFKNTVRILQWTQCISVTFSNV
jgi:hypothetical protein